MPDLWTCYCVCVPCVYASVCLTLYNRRWCFLWFIHLSWFMDCLHSNVPPLVWGQGIRADDGFLLDFALVVMKRKYCWRGARFSLRMHSFLLPLHCWHRVALMGQQGAAQCFFIFPLSLQSLILHSNTVLKILAVFQWFTKRAFY